ncbi:unnamed protein product [Cuscuta epithymum]|uniref:Uncharacterized protein n=1 Tax=Cuscuta epithymum TaxID=186058 RepID=A0AAV0FTN5_9ASTE|nr:unnamed protein product [Cuscuta epithymum]CAH9138575.1 unnamed protein product [Cuscuta epithymum]
MVVEDKCAEKKTAAIYKFGGFGLLQSTLLFVAHINTHYMADAISVHPS